jgi:hypothetical protein
MSLNRAPNLLTSSGMTSFTWWFKKKNLTILYYTIPSYTILHESSPARSRKTKNNNTNTNTTTNHNNNYKHYTTRELGGSAESIPCPVADKKTINNTHTKQTHYTTRAMRYHTPGSARKQTKQQILHYTALHYTILYYTILYYTILICLRNAWPQTTVAK